MRERYPNTRTDRLAEELGRRVSTVYQHAIGMGLRKTPEYLASPDASRLRRDCTCGIPYRFKKGQIPPNKGLRRPGWGPGRMKQTQFKKGHVSANRRELGELRLNADGYVDMKVSERKGARAWKAFHVVLWEDAHGPVPPGHAVVFKDRDTLNIDLPNLELLSRAQLMVRNSIHNLPPEIKSTIHVLGQLKRRIREKQDRGFAQPSL